MYSEMSNIQQNNNGVILYIILKTFNRIVCVTPQKVETMAIKLLVFLYYRTNIVADNCDPYI